MSQLIKSTNLKSIHKSFIDKNQNSRTIHFISEEIAGCLQGNTVARRILSARIAAILK